MFAKRIIPCLDVTDGRVVKGTNFVNLRDAGDPIELAKRYDEQGADELVFLDITASSDKRYILRDLVERTAKQVFIPFTVGGGINDLDTIYDLLSAGADKVSINTAAVKTPQLIKKSSKQFGSQCIVVAVDAKAISAPSNVTSAIPEVSVDSNSKWEVFTHGGRYPTGIDAIKWVKYMTYLGAGEILLTSMDHDGTKSGYATELTQTVSQSISIPVIASGGAGSVSHIADVLSICEAALLASLLHYQELTISGIKQYCLDQQLSMRL